MLCDLVKKIATQTVLCASLLGLSGCTFKNYSINSIRDAPVIEQRTDDECRIQFATLTWQEALRLVHTPSQAQQYCNFIKQRALLRNNRDDGTHCYSFRLIHEGAPVDCSEAVYAAAALLSDNGYQPLMLMIVQDELVLANGELYKPAHAVFLYRQNGKFGSAGLNESDFHNPVFESVNELVREIARSFEDEGYNLTRYTVVNLAENDPDYITTDRNMQRDIDAEHEIE